MYVDFTSTPVYNQAALRYPAVGTLGETEIPLHLTDLKVSSRNSKVNVVNNLPRYVNLTPQKAISIALGPQELPKLSIQGYITSPTSQSGTYNIPNVQMTNKVGTIFFVDYAMLITAYLEGRAVGTTDWNRTDPKWFRDNYGRVFTAPRVLDFVAQWVENVPGRTTFTMVLQI